MVNIRAASPFAFLLLLLATPALADRNDLPKAGDHLQSLPGQPLCSSVDELALYLRTQLGVDKKARKFKTCGDMPPGVEFIVLEVSQDDPELPMRPAKIRVVARGGASIVGWTVLVAEDDP